jgi:hypothetical protein
MSKFFAAAALLLSIGTVVAYGLLLRALIAMRPALYLSLLALGVVFAAAALARRRGWLTMSALVVSVLVLGLGVVFNFVLTRVPTAQPPAFVVGQPAPDFTLPDSTGRPASLADYRGKKPVVLVFYRGYW